MAAIRRHNLRPDRSESGSVMVVVMFLALGLGAMALAHLTRVVAEERKIQGAYNAQRAQALADGQIAIAQNIVNSAPYAGGENTAIRAAIDSDPPFVPGTTVEVEAVPGSSGWYSLVARGEYVGSAAVAQILVRDRKPTTSYNYFVVDHPLGVSGKPRGLIHSNKTVDFYFPGGEYRDRVSAVEGFQWRAGALPENTTFLGGATGNAQSIDPLADADVTDAKAIADLLLVEDALEAEISLEGTTAVVKLFQPAHTISEERTGTRNVVDRYETRSFTRRVPVYRTERVAEERPIWTRVTTREDVSVPIYEERDVEVEVERRVWVEDEPPPPESLGGGAIAATSLGHWETVRETETRRRNVVVGYRTEERDRHRWVQTGTETVMVDRRVFSHYEEVVEEREVPVYRSEEYTYFRNVWIPRSYVRTEEVGAVGTIYIEGDITRLSGVLVGELSIVSNGEVKITDSLQYVDADGQPAMAGGLDPEADYAANPDYRGNSVLSVAARGDILYDKNCPDYLEINAALTSTHGKVAFEGLRVSSEGDEVTSTLRGDRESYVKKSIRRLGGIVSRYRPVATLMASSGGVIAGFESGQTVMDQRLLVGSGGSVTPPFTFEQNEPLWGTRSSGRILGLGHESPDEDL